MLLYIIYSVILVVISFTPVQPKEKEYPQVSFKIQRERMVETQLKSRGINNNNILDAFLKVERHLFVPSKYKSWAYYDGPLPIGEGQTISQPYIVALMTQELKLSSSDKVLEVGTGSGYQAAILAELDADVYSIEVIKNLAIRAKNMLARLGYKNIHLKTGDGYNGWPEFAPYNAIIVTCAPSKIPQPLKDQLAEGGRMIIPVGRQGTIQKLVLLNKQKGKIKQRSVLPVRFVPMIDSLKISY